MVFVFRASFLTKRIATRAALFARGSGVEVQGLGLRVAKECGLECFFVFLVVSGSSVPIQACI